MCIIKYIALCIIIIAILCAAAYAMEPPSEQPTRREVEFYEDIPDQPTRETAWMIDAEVNWKWYDKNEAFGEIMNRLVNQFGYSKAAAYGIAANMSEESLWNPNITAPDGSGSFGLCQWLGKRKTDLMNWCYANNYDPCTIEGQLAWMDHELDSGMYDVDLDWGAYDCAYNFCVHFEMPSHPHAKGDSRGNLALSYWEEFEE